MFLVQINLKEPSFIPGKKNYERVLKCLSEFVDLQMDFLFAWEPPDESLEQEKQICPSTVAAYFSVQGYTVSECKPEVVTSRQYNVKLPNKTTSPSELLEWFGAVALGININPQDAEGQYLSSYVGPESGSQETQVAVIKHFGFFTTTQIEKLFKHFSAHVGKRRDETWSALHVQGFSDSPVSWSLQEHTFHSNGDNSYTILLQPDLSFLLNKACSFSKKIKLKLK